MRGFTNEPGQSATNGDGKSAVEESADGKSAIDDIGWFAEMARALLSEKPGTALWAITGYDERLCQRYAAGHTKPSAHFLRILLRSEQGAPFFEFLMDGCDAEWWRSLKLERRVGAAALSAMNK